jgi:hypothetical protein
MSNSVVYIYYKYKVGDTVKFKDKFPTLASCSLRGLEGTTAVIEARANYAGPTYKLAGYDGYFKESCFSGKVEADSCEKAEIASTTAVKAGGPSKYMPETENATESENEAFWDFSVTCYAKCSNCGRSFEALPDIRMFSENNRFCRMCGKPMGVRYED